MKFAYENLGEDQFEDLIVCLCKKLLGVSVQGFSKGKDGGRDAKFVGKAEIFPSTTKPWYGTVVVQAKHTNGYNKSFSEPDFYSEKSVSSIIAKELPRIKKLKEDNHLNHYMLFSNRKLTGIAETEIREYIARNTGVPIESIYLCGVEELERFFKQFPDVPKYANIDPVDAPLYVSPDDLSNVIQAIAKHREEFKIVFDDPPTPRISYEDKNAVNSMSKEYAEAIRKKYLKETSQIRLFLAAPANMEMLKLYESIVDEFQLKIIAKRKHHQGFDELMEYLVELLFNRDAILRQYKKLTRAVLFYMYWNCDIGVSEDVETN